MAVLLWMVILLTKTIIGLLYQSGSVEATKNYVFTHAENLSVNGFIPINCDIVIEWFDSVVHRLSDV